MREQVKTTLNDILFIFNLALVIIVFALIFHINPPSKKDEAVIKSPGQIIAEIRWFPDDLNCDVDLWVQSPHGIPVGYSNLKGRVWNLLRDDLGAGSNDYLGLNYEHAFSRGIMPGDYVVNIHMYGPLPSGTEIPVRVVVAVREKYGTTRQLLQTTIKLRYRNQEETAYRFRLTSEGELVEGSVSTLRRNLITRPGANN